MTSRIGNIEAVIFDLDETLIDAQRGLKAAHERVADLLHRFLRENEKNIERREIDTIVRRMDDEFNRQIMYDRNLWWQKILEELGYNKTLPKPFIKGITSEYWKIYEEASVPYPDAISTLEYLRKETYKLGLLTDDDGTVGFKRQRILNLSFKDFFEATVVAGDEVAERKPSPLPFLLIADKLEASPCRCVMVGDKPFTDIRGGRSAGMITIHIQRRKWADSIEADYEVTSLAELRTFL